MRNPCGTGRLNDDQIKYLNNLKLLGFKTLVSNDYTQIISQTNDSMSDVKITCPSCIKHLITDWLVAQRPVVVSKY